jgi:hypothetical protein
MVYLLLVVAAVVVAYLGRWIVADEVRIRRYHDALEKAGDTQEE